MIKKGTPAIGLSIITALASSLCCITPMLALVAGTSSVAANFSWIEPLRPYLVGFTCLILCFAWYQKMKPQVVAADCCTVESLPKKSFLQGTMFLGIVTSLALLLTAFPYYSKLLVPSPQAENTTILTNTETVEFKVSGMTCESCEHHITSAVNQLPGIRSVKASFANNNSIIEFDPQHINIRQIQQALDETGYVAEEYKSRLK